MLLEVMPCAAPTTRSPKPHSCAVPPRGTSPRVEARWPRISSCFRFPCSFPPPHPSPLLPLPQAPLPLEVPPQTIQSRLVSQHPWLSASPEKFRRLHCHHHASLQQLQVRFPQQSVFSRVPQGSNRPQSLHFHQSQIFRQSVWEPEEQR